MRDGALLWDAGLSDLYAIEPDEFVLARALPPARIRFRELVEALRHDDDRRLLLAASPVSFTRRNLFVDSTVGDRV